MKKPSSKPLRFTIDRKGDRSYVLQLTEAIRSAIECGYYRDGDVLPSLDELSESVGVSIIVPREAVARLAEEGLVIPRRGVGSIVNVPRQNARQGHVLLVTSEISDNFTVASVCGVLRQELVKAGYIVSQVSVIGDPSGRADFSQLDAVLAGAVSLVVLMTGRWEIARHVDKTGIPMIVTAGEKSSGKNIVGRFGQGVVPVGDFVAHCVRAGIEDVVEVTFDKAASVVVDALRTRGVRAREWHFPPCANEHPEYSSVEKRMFDAIVSLCRSGKRLPDLFFFGDDIAARGAMTAFLTKGVRVPKDVKVVARTAYGRQPVFGLSLTRIESNPKKVGQSCAAYVLDVLKGNRVAVSPCVAETYVLGKTFPDPCASSE